MLLLEQKDECLDEELIFLALKNIDDFNKIASRPLRFKNLDEIKVVRHLVEIAFQEKAKTITFEDGSVFTLDVRGTTAAEYLNEGEKLGLNNKKLIDYVNNGLKEVRKSAISLLDKLEKMGLVNDSRLPEKFLSRLAERSHISLSRLDELVCMYGFRYIQANTLWVHKNGFKHFGSDLLRAYRENPAKAKLGTEI